MKNILIALFFSLILIPTARAEDIAATQTPVVGGTAFKWLNITDGDTVQAFKWPGGKGSIIASGTWDSMDVEVVFAPLASATGTEDTLDPDEKPDGFQFTESGGMLFTLPVGMMDLRFDSAAGNTTDVDFIIAPIPSNTGN